CRSTDTFSPLASQPGPIRRDLPSRAGQQPAEMTWVDLPPTDRLTLSTARERYDLPPEALTYFLLHYQSAKLNHAGPTLFLITFLAVPSLRHLFTTRELKICVTPTQIVTLYGSSGRTQPGLARTLPLLAGLSGGGVGRFLCGLLVGVVGSYEAVVKTVEERRVDDVPWEGRQRWHQQVEKLIRFLRDERVFLNGVAREGGKLFTAEESQQLLCLEARVGRLARVVWNTIHPKQDETAPSRKTGKGGGHT